MAVDDYSYDARFVIVSNGGTKLASFSVEKDALEYAQAFRDRRGFVCEVIDTQETKSDGD